MSYLSEAAGGDGIFASLLKAAEDFESAFGSVLHKRATNGYLSQSSIMKASKDLVMSFPVLCSDTVSPATASMITKATERNCVTTLQLLFSAANMSGTDGISVIRKWHRNMDANIGMDDYLNVVDAVSGMMKESKTLADAAAFGQEMVAECARNTKVYPLNSFSETAVCDYIVEGEKGEVNVRHMPRVTNEAWEPRKSPSGLPIPGAWISNRLVKDPQSGRFDDADDIDLRMRQAEIDNDRQRIASQRAANAARDAREEARDKANSKHNKTQEKYWDAQKDNWAAQQDLDKQKFAFEKEKWRQQVARQNTQDQFEYFQKQLLPSDVKKANELVPSMIIIRYNAVDPDSKERIVGDYQQFIAGVKARLIACSSREIIDAIVSSRKNSVSFFNLVRATTKEIKFARDFVAGIEQAKIDAKRNSKLNRTSPIWRSLQWRSSRSVLSRLKKSRANDAGAITTLVITQEEANYIKNNYNIDLNIPTEARDLMATYNLMQFVIVDEELEVARFLIDGEQYFQDYSFNSLERETGDGSYKKIVNLLSRVNRG